MFKHKKILKFNYFNFVIVRTNYCYIVFFYIYFLKWPEDVRMKQNVLEENGLLIIHIIVAH